MPQFSPLKRTKHLPDMIVSQIMEQIASGSLKPGDTLPTETTLAETFGVSRNVVREAIARLRSDRVVETKQGRGAVVLPTSERATFRIELSELDKEGSVSHLFELRGLLEIDAAGIAALRRTGQDISDLEDAVERMEGVREFDEQRLDADAEFHRILGEATGNEYLASIVDYLSGRLKETTRATVKVYEDNDLVAVTIGEHRDILEAVKSGNVTAARAAMTRHIQGAARRLGVDQVH